jgi:hypothetical protein
MFKLLAKLLGGVVESATNIFAKIFEWFGDIIGGIFKSKVSEAASADEKKTAPAASTETAAAKTETQTVSTPPIEKTAQKKTVEPTPEDPGVDAKTRAEIKRSIEGIRRARPMTMEAAHNDLREWQMSLTARHPLDETLGTPANPIFIQDEKTGRLIVKAPPESRLEIQDAKATDPHSPPNPEDWVRVSVMPVGKNMPLHETDMSPFAGVEILAKKKWIKDNALLADLSKGENEIGTAVSTLLPGTVIPVLARNGATATNSNVDVQILSGDTFATQIGKFVNEKGVSAKNDKEEAMQMAVTRLDNDVREREEFYDGQALAAVLRKARGAELAQARRENGTAYHETPRGSHYTHVVRDNSDPFGGISLRGVPLRNLGTGYHH